MDVRTTHVSVTVSITASGKLFKPMLVCKGTFTGQIALREFQPKATGMKNGSNGLFVDKGKRESQKMEFY